MLYAQGIQQARLNGFLLPGLALLLGILIGYLLFQSLRNRKDKALKQTEKDIIEQAEEKARQVELEAKENALRITREAEEDLQRRRAELSKEDDRLVKRREELDRRFDQMQQREAALNTRQSSMDRRANEIEALYEQRGEELQRAA